MVNRSAKTAVHLSLSTTPDEFFFELVQQASEKQSAKIDPEVEYYMVRLLKRFINSEQLFTKDGQGTLKDQPIAFLIKDALEEPDPNSKKSLFQNAGDISLYKAGFFQESIQESRIDVDYYIGMGGLAYSQAADMSGVKTDQSLFRSLSKQFPTCVDVLFEVSEMTTPTKTEQDLFRLYEMWAKTGSERAARALLRAGIPLKKKEEVS